MLVAGPGSGKTATMTERIRRMILEARIPSGKILVITFSRAAAAEMESRFRKKMAQQETEVVFGTFHSVFLHLMKNYYGSRFSFRLCDEACRQQMLKDILLQNGYPFIIKDLLDAVLLDISLRKNTDMSQYQTSEGKQEDFQRIYLEYERCLRKKGLMDFDDILLLMQQSLTYDPAFLRYCRTRFDYILIDEFQDINAVQFSIVRMLAAEHRNLFVVGDEDQSIYGFRGSRPQIMLDFPKYFPGCRQIALSKNYRSGTRIVEASKALIVNNKKRFAKQMDPANSFSGEVQLLEYKDREMENAAMDTYFQAHTKESCAVLCRTNQLKQYYGFRLKNVGNSLSFLTMHEAKGLEFDHVWIPEANDGIYPYRHGEGSFDAEEERRIFYVGMTRAAKCLMISSFSKGNRGKLQKSIYLSEICKKDRNSFYVQKRHKMI